MMIPEPIVGGDPVAHRVEAFGNKTVTMLAAMSLFGHEFTFQVPPNPKVKFDGLTVHCEVLECEPPSRLAFSWSVGGPVVGTRVVFQLEPKGEGTRLLFEHSGFDISQPMGKQAFAGAGFGWTKMLDQLTAVVARPTTK